MASSDAKSNFKWIHKGWYLYRVTQIARFMGPTWGSFGSCQPQGGPCWPYMPCYQGYTYLAAVFRLSWWRHQMETFSALLAICSGKSPASGEIPVQRPVTRRFVVFFDLFLNKRLREQSWGWWFETLSHPLWRHCYVVLGEVGLTWSFFNDKR